MTAEEKAYDLGTGLSEIGMGVLLTGHENVGFLNHALRQASMKIKASPDKSPLTHGFPEPGQDLPFRIAARLGHHGAVQIEGNEIKPSLCRRLHNLFREKLKGRLRHGPTRRRHRSNGRQDFEPLRTAFGEYATENRSSRRHLK